MSLKKALSLRVFLCLMLFPLLFSCAPLVFGNEPEVNNHFETEYAKGEWEISVSKARITPNEDFYATIDLTATIKKIPEKYRGYIDIAKNLGINFTVSISYQTFARNNENGEVTLYSSEMGKEIPASKMEIGNTLKFEERIPPEGNLAFPEEADFGNYTLFIKLEEAKAEAMGVSKDMNKLFTAAASDPGIEIGTVYYGMLADVNSDGIVDGSDLKIVADVFNTKPPSNPKADVNKDGIVDIFDLVIVGNNSGR